MESILGVIGGLPSGTPVAFGWGWLVELLEDYGFAPHLVHPLQCKAIASARLTNDKADAAILAQLLRADLLPKAWIAPPTVAGMVRLWNLAGGAGDHGEHRPGRVEEHCEPAHARDVHGGD